MKKYKIWNIKEGMFAEDKIIEAETPKEAVKKLYPDHKVERDYTHMFGSVMVKEVKQGRIYEYYIEKEEQK